MNLDRPLTAREAEWWRNATDGMLSPRDRLRDQLDRGKAIVVVSDGSAHLGGVYGSGEQSTTEVDRMSCRWVFGGALTVEGSEVGVDAAVGMRLDAAGMNHPLQRKRRGSWGRSVWSWSADPMRGDWEVWVRWWARTLLMLRCIIENIEHADIFSRS